MPNILLERDKAVVQDDDALNVQRHNVHSYEAEIFRRVIKENWKSKINDDNSKQVVAMLEEHAATMQRTLGSYEYEILSLPNIINTCKRMSKSEIRQYLKMLEALAVGYKNRYGSDMVSLLLAGLSLKAKDIDAAQRYFRLLTTELEARLAYFSTAANSETRRIDALSLSLSYKEASLFTRFFKGHELRALKKKIDTKAKRKKKLEEKRVRYHNMLSKVKAAAELKPEDGK